MYYTCMYITQILSKIVSDVYTQFGVDADLVGVGSLKWVWLIIIIFFFCATILQPHHTNTRPAPAV